MLSNRKARFDRDLFSDAGLKKESDKLTDQYRLGNAGLSAFRRSWAQGTQFGRMRNHGRAFTSVKSADISLTSLSWI